jgi:hypothetical protein
MHRVAERHGLAVSEVVGNSHQLGVFRDSVLRG